MFRKISLLMAGLIIISAAAACSSTATTTATTTVTQSTTATVTVTNSPTAPTVTSTVTVISVAPTPTATGTPTTTAGDLSSLGSSKYEADCTFTYCHASFGPRGSSGSLNGIPADVEFGTSPLSYFGNAQNLFVFIKSFMHHPDTVSFLTDDDYVQILAFLLTQNGTLQSSDPFGLSNLASVKLNP